MTAVEEEFERFCEEQEAVMHRRDLEVRVEITHVWDSKKQNRSPSLQYQVFSYRNRDSCAPAGTLITAIENARKAIIEAESYHEADCKTKWLTPRFCCKPKMCDKCACDMNN